MRKALALAILLITFSAQAQDPATHNYEFANGSWFVEAIELKIYFSKTHIDTHQSTIDIQLRLAHSQQYPQQSRR